MLPELEGLVERARAGDARAFDALVRRFQDAAVAYALAWTGDRDEADDIAQDAFVDAFLKLHALRHPAAFPSWLRTILRKQADRRRRRRRSHAPESLDDGVDQTPGPDRRRERTEEAETVRAAVAGLPRALREPVLLYYFGGLDVRQTAVFLEVPAGTVKRRLHEARSRLRHLESWEVVISGTRPSRDERLADRVRTLICAAAHGRADEVREIIGVEPGAIEAEGPHPFWGGRPRALHTAVESRQLDVVEALLEAGADPNPDSEAYDGWTPLLIAITGGSCAIEQRLLARGAVIDAWSAAAGGFIDRLRALIRSDPHVVHARGPNDATPLHFAISLDVVRLLVDSGADPLAKDKYGSTATRAVAYSRRAQREAATELRELSGEDDIFVATAIGDLDGVRALLRDDPQSLETIDRHLNAASAWGSRPLHIAASRSDTRTAAALLELGADPNGRARDGETPLHYAAKFGDDAMIRLLMAAGADVTLRDDITDASPAAWADFFGQHHVMPLLLRADAH
jgi:RNA polymerase sigma factor (sigma-70 family)